MRHWRIFSSAMPVPLPCFDMYDVADGNSAFFLFRCDDPVPGRYDKNLVAVMRVPAGCCAFTKVDHVAAKILGFTLCNHRLARTGNGATGQSGNWRSTAHSFFRQIIKLYHSHLSNLPLNTVASTSY